MTKYNLHIVALPYLDLKPWFEASDCERIAAYYEEAMGRLFTLRESEANNVEIKAVIAYDWQGRRVGYVKDNEKMNSLAMMIHSGRKSLRGRVAEINAEHKCLTVEVESDWDGKQPDINLDEDFSKWHYGGPLMKTTEMMENLYFMKDEINDRLEEMGEWTDVDRDDFYGLMENFCRLTKFDISAEMIDYRKQLSKRLSTLLQDLALKVELENGHAGRETNEGEVKDYWLNMLTSQGRSSRLYAEREKHCVAKIEDQLREFPNNLYNTWVNSRDQFVARMYYMHIPRQVLWSFCSGIAFVEMMRRDDRSEGENVEEFVHRMLGVAKHSLKRNETALEGMRLVLSEMGYTDADEDLDAWMDNKEEENKSYTDRQIAVAIEEICGEGKPLNSKQLWAAVYWCLRWYCNFPVKGNDFCNRIAMLPFSRELEYECSYNNIRRLVTLSFMNQDARNMDVVKPSKMDETFFSQCRTVVLALVDSLERIAT